MRCTFLLAAFISFYLPCSSAVASLFSLGDLYFDSVADHRDIPDGIVTAIAQDKQGFIWLGTQQGAIRFDGYQFVQYSHEDGNPNSLAGNYIRTIWSAPDGKLWFGTFSDGLSVFNPKDQAFEHFDLSLQDDERNSNSVRAIVGEASHRVWVATNQAVSYLNPYSKKVVTVTNIKGCENVYQNQEPRSLMSDKSGGLWLGTQNGLCRISLPAADYDATTLTGRSFAQFDGMQIRSMLHVNSNQLYLGTLQHGLASFNLGSQQVRWINAKPGQLGHPWVVSMIKDGDQVWAGTLDGGISIIAIDSFSISKQIRHDRSINSSINQNNIGALFRDRSGLIWIGTWGAGLNLFNPANDSIRTIRHSPYQKSIKSARIRAITETDSGDIWVGYSQAGLSRIAVPSGIVTHIGTGEAAASTLPDNDILSLMHTQDEELWVGSRRNGLFRYAPQSGQFQTFPDATQAGLKTVTAMAKDGQSRLWIGSTRGIWYADLQQKTVHSIADYQNYQPLQGRITYTLAWQNPNNLWVGTDDGLFNVNPETRRVQHITSSENTPDSLSDNAINSLHTDQNQHLWIATEQGLDKLLSWDGQRASFLSIDKTLDIKPTYTANIIADKQARIWHYKGLYDIANKTAIDLSKSHEWDIGTIWLGSQEVTREGVILFGGNEGLLLINPERYHNRTSQPDIVITALEIDNQAAIFSPHKGLRLAPGTQSFSLEFAALDYTSAAEIRYRWQLIGFDKTWQTAGAENRRATYTNLPPGDYQLNIESTNNAGEWQQNRLTIPVQRQPAWFETWWFFLLLVSCITFLIWRLFVLRTHHLVRQKRNLNTQVHQKTQALSQANIDKDRIMSIVAHDINNKIAIGLGYLDLMKLAGDKLDKADLQRYLDQAILAGQSCATLVEELRDYGKLSNETDEIERKTTNLVKSLDNIIESHQPKALAKKLHLTFKHDRDVIFCELHQAKFSRIMENLLSNAIKFSYEGQHINVTVTRQEAAALIAVQDEGIGIPDNLREQLFSAFSNVGREGTQKEKSTGLGLYIVKKLVQQHRGEVWFKSENRKGSCFYVQLPITD